PRFYSMVWLTCSTAPNAHAVTGCTSRSISALGPSVPACTASWGMGWGYRGGSVGWPLSLWRLSPWLGCTISAVGQVRRREKRLDSIHQHACRDSKRLSTDKG